MKVSDYIAELLAAQGIRHVFGLTGGAVVHLFDSVARHPEMTAVFAHHEQAAAFAGQSYARVLGGPGAVVVTTGPGGTNAVSGLAAAWLDSVPCLYISGQVRLAHTGRGHDVRQVGTQHLDIVSVVKSLTKYAVMIDDINLIKYHLQKALYIAQQGRPGPVWVDIPLDMQWGSIEPDDLPSFDPAELAASPDERAGIDECVRLLTKAERPILLAGYGVRLAGAEAEFKRVVESFRLPYLTTWNASDLSPVEHPQNTGRPGLFGQRGANLAIQNSDLVLSVGSHLCVSLTGTMFDAFARAAKIVMVDVDPAELAYRTVRVDLAVEMDARSFLAQLLEAAADLRLSIDPWREKCREYAARYNSRPAAAKAADQRVDPYTFIETLSEAAAPDDLIVVDGGGTINQITFQAFRLKEGQRIVISAGLCAMGSGLPDAIGACFAAGRRRTIMLCGDGSMQLNIHELQTVLHHDLPIKIFVLCNEGYVSIRQTQAGFLGSNFVGSGEVGGVSLPDYSKVGKAYGLPTFRIDATDDLAARLREVLDAPGPAVCEIIAPADYEPVPRQGFDRRPDGTNVPRPLEDMYPYIAREEFRSQMLVPLWGEPEHPK